MTEEPSNNPSSGYALRNRIREIYAEAYPGLAPNPNPAEDLEFIAAKLRRRPEGDAGDAVDWAVDHLDSFAGKLFLDDWRGMTSGSLLAKYPGYAKWLATQRAGAEEAASV